MPATRATIVIEQGASYEQEYDIAAEGVTDFTGYEAASQLRATAAGALVQAFTVTWLSRTAPAAIACVLTAAETVALAAGTYVYDVRLTAPDGGVQYPRGGSARVLPHVTRDA